MPSSSNVQGSKECSVFDTSSNNNSATQPLIPVDLSPQFLLPFRVTSECDYNRNITVKTNMK